MDSTDGLARGTDVIATGSLITVPIGDQTLGRIWNVLGEPVDKKDPASGERSPIHRDPPGFRTCPRRSRSSRRESRSST